MIWLWLILLLIISPRRKLSEWGRTCRIFLCGMPVRAKRSWWPTGSLPADICMNVPFPDYLRLAFMLPSKRPDLSCLPGDGILRLSTVCRKGRLIIVRMFLHWSRSVIFQAGSVVWMFCHRCSLCPDVVAGRWYVPLWMKCMSLLMQWVKQCSSLPGRAVEEDCCVFLPRRGVPMSKAGWPG